MHSLTLSVYIDLILYVMYSEVELNTDPSY